MPLCRSVDSSEISGRLKTTKLKMGKNSPTAQMALLEFILDHSPLLNFVTIINHAMFIDDDAISVKQLFQPQYQKYNRLSEVLLT